MSLNSYEKRFKNKSPQRIRHCDIPDPEKLGLWCEKVFLRKNGDWKISLAV